MNRDDALAIIIRAAQSECHNLAVEEAGAIPSRSNRARRERKEIEDAIAEFTPSACTRMRI